MVFARTNRHWIILIWTHGNSVTKNRRIASSTSHFPPPRKASQDFLPHNIHFNGIATVCIAYPLNPCVCVCAYKWLCVWCSASVSVGSVALSRCLLIAFVLRDFTQVKSYRHKGMECLKHIRSGLDRMAFNRHCVWNC